MKKKKQIEAKVGLDSKLVKHAVEELQKLFVAKKNSRSLLQEEQTFIYVNVLLSEVPTLATPRPQRIDLPNPIYSKDYDT